jgi:hypothetical protein
MSYTPVTGLNGKIFNFKFNYYSIHPGISIGFSDCPDRILENKILGNGCKPLPAKKQKNSRQRKGRKTGLYLT